jgi:6,7-dimethyl-8-ribityllumazine synthase
MPVDGLHNETAMDKITGLVASFLLGVRSFRRAGTNSGERGARVMQQGIDETKIPRIEGAKIAILKSRWYPDVVESLADACRTALKKAGCSSVSEHTLPGVFELPFAVHHLVRKIGQRFDAIICLGVVLKGDTFHFEMITPEVFSGLARLSLEIDIPILVEILPVLELGHAVERAGKNEFNKGLAAASAAAEIIAWRRSAG